MSRTLKPSEWQVIKDLLHAAGAVLDDDHVHNAMNLVLRKMQRAHARPAEEKERRDLLDRIEDRSDSLMGNLRRLRAIEPEVAAIVLGASFERTTYSDDGTLYVEKLDPESVAEAGRRYDELMRLLEVVSIATMYRAHDEETKAPTKPPRRGPKLDDVTAVAARVLLIQLAKVCPIPMRDDRGKTSRELIGILAVLLQAGHPKGAAYRDHRLAAQRVLRKELPEFEKRRAAEKAEIDRVLATMNPAQLDKFCRDLEGAE